MKKPNLLVVEDDENIRTQMKWALVREYEVFLAEDSEAAMLTMENEHPPLVTLDLGLPPNPEDTSEGLKLLERILQYQPATKVIVVTGNPDRSAAVKTISLGAHDFFTKPIDIEEIKAILKRAHYVSKLESEHKTLQKKLQDTAFGEIIGSSSVMQKIFATVRKVATTDVSVLVTGESGTGKELVSKAIHDRSIRKDEPFIPINCGAIPENLMESELFGHEKGAFTGAHAQRKGRMELADGGTLFLDEIGELPLSLQVKILRFLQDHKIERVGGRESREIDVRVIAATNRDLKKLVSEGRFREELYYRLAVITIDLPPLREREDDVLMLANVFLQKTSTGTKRPRHLSREAAEAINAYKWPGNVRELENRIRRATTLAESHVITPKDIDLGAEQYAEQNLNLKKAREYLDRRYIYMAMAKHKGNVSKAAEELGFSRPTLHHLMKKYKVKQEKGH
ncbi:MAG: sigma-54-dependent Fis family transcriptional regulator [bacterium]|nr:MAG: sigma-54-dependent Fis family transcriptional regulator [bacterium]